jgi:hypothetical protein
MKVFVSILSLFFFTVPALCQYTPAGYVYIGNVNCNSKEHYLDSAKKAYQNAWIYNDIHNSRHIIDIQLVLDEYPDEISARLYWDSTFTLYYTGYYDQNDGSVCVLDTVFSSKDISIDSLFHKVVESGIFTLPYVSDEGLAKSWKAMFIGKQDDLLASDHFRVSHGANYILTYKVNNCYGQHVFHNADIYSSYYIDHPVFKRQVAIIDAIMGGYFLQKKLIFP